MICVRLAVTALTLSLLGGCVSVPLAFDGATPSAPAQGPGYPLCVITQERVDRFTLNGLDRFSFANWNEVIASVVMQRPDGLLVVDPAFGKTIRADLTHVPALLRLVTGDAEGKTPLVTLMAQAGLDPDAVKWAAITHAHWDHTGALGELKQAKIFLSRTEHEWAKGLHEEFDHGALTHQLARAGDRWAPLELDGPPLYGFEASKDVFGDGSVIALPLTGHTPGQLGYLLRDAKGERWLFLGDAAWLLRGVEEPAHKGAFARMLDSDGKQTGVTLGKLHALLKAHPELHLVPAHDARGYVGLPECTRR